jgi:sortase A
MRDRRYVEELTLQELEQVLIVRRREERLARLRRMGIAERLGSTVIVNDIASAPSFLEPIPADAEENQERTSAGGQSMPADKRQKSGFHIWKERILLSIEVVALLGLLAVIVSLLANVRNLNRDWKEQQSTNPLPTPTATALIRAAILPGGHRPPAMRGGEAVPLVSAPKITIPTPGPRSPTRLKIPSINVDVPVVEGDDWEQLAKGAGHHIGSANPGERGNTFISGHNDVYGEIFRDLEQVSIGDEIIVYSGKQPYRYIVRATRIIDPDDVSVMYPTSTPVLTLLTCYPYMIDTHRLVVIAELER